MRAFSDMSCQFDRELYFVSFVYYTADDRFLSFLSVVSARRFLLSYSRWCIFFMVFVNAKRRCACIAQVWKVVECTQLGVRHPQPSLRLMSIK